MRKLIPFLILLASIPAAFAQTTSVTASLVDADSTTWVLGSCTTTLIYRQQSPIVAPYYNAGGNVPLNPACTVSGSGILTATLSDVKFIAPIFQATWQFKVCPNVGPNAACGTVNIPVTGGSQNVSSLLSLPAPRVGGGVGATAYADVEVSAVYNNTYWQIPAGACRTFTTTWGACGGGGGGGGLPAGTGVVKVVGGSGSLAVVGTDYLNPSSTGTISVKDPAYGAVCNWNGTTGTNDATAFQAAATAAGATYSATGTPQTIVVPYGCTLGTGSGNPTITVPSGVRFAGPGSIFVPAQSTNALFQMTSTDNNAFDKLMITYVTNLSGCAPTVNNDLCIAIRYDSADPGTTATHHNVFIRDNVILNSGWGVLLGPQAGTDLLDGCTVTGNMIGQTNDSPITSYKFNDGIHLGGAISSCVVANNVITGRSDAGVAISSEFSTVNRVCHDITITGNQLYEDRVGIDNSGCSNLVISGNNVNADIPIGNSNPAFRSIFYANQLPNNVTVSGNYFHNDETLTGSDVSAKFDCFGGCGNGAGTVNLMNSSFTGNHLKSLYVDGSQVNISGNLFEDNLGYNSGTNTGQESITVNWDTVNVNGSYYVTIGPNDWQYRGQINLANRSDIYFQDILYPQNTTNGQLTIINGQNFGVPQQSAFYNYLVPSGGSYGFGSTTPGVGAAIALSCMSASGGVILFEESNACGTAIANASAPAAFGAIYDTGLTNGTGVICPNGTSGVFTQSGCAVISALTGDVTASGVGSTAATVRSIGGGPTFASQPSGPECGTTGTGVVSNCPNVASPGNVSAITSARNGVYVVPCTNTPVFDLSQGNVQLLILTTGCNAVTSSSVINTPAVGQHQDVTFVIQQDATGGRPFPNPTWTSSWTPQGLLPNDQTSTVVHFYNYASGSGTAVDNAGAAFCALSGSGGTLACGGARSGFFSIPGGSSVSVTINSTAVTSTSAAFVTPDSTIGSSVTPTVTCTASSVVPQITGRVPGTSFTVTFPGTTTGNICADFILGNR